MRSDTEQRSLGDILYHIDLATAFVAGFDRQAFRSDLRTVYAVTRCLEIISEASRRLSDELKARHPAIAWKQMAGAGNVYRHDYEDVAAEFVWDTVEPPCPCCVKPYKSKSRKGQGEASKPRPPRWGTGRP